MIRPCADPRHRNCLGPKCWDPDFDSDDGPGCGTANHPPSCLCDVILKGTP